ncbi:MAG TPA: hypothetical protein VMF65_20530 [Acidimicrobiales bacterium]|nr:hypothetical protein [Acidimicrobiales bacterium]
MARTVDYARSTMGEQAWHEAITPELSPSERIPNPYTYTRYSGSDDRHRARQDDAGGPAASQVVTD